MKIWLVILSWLFSVSCFGSNFVISEIFANAKGSGTDKNKEWFEIYNPENFELKLSSIEIRRLDGVVKKEARRFVWRSSEAVVVHPKGYLVVAQSRDLGLDQRTASGEQQRSHHLSCA